MRTHAITVLSAIGLAVFSISAASTQERSSGSSLDVQSTWSALKTLVETNNAQLVGRISPLEYWKQEAEPLLNTLATQSNAMAACSKINALWKPTASDPDRCEPIDANVFDPDKDYSTKVISGGKRGNDGCGHYPDDKTSDKLCRDAGFDGVSGVATGEYGDPGDECVYTWEGSRWEKWGSLEKNNMNLYLDKLTCYKFRK